MVKGQSTDVVKATEVCEGGDVEKVSPEELFISEPSPYMFGNPSNKVTKHWTNDNWLKSRFHFSFAEYRNKDKMNFGVLRVMNDDLVQPLRGFGEHPHRDMEIVTYVVDGELTHEDSTGNKESLGRGSVQFMSAGTGLYHSERNDHGEKPCRFIQMWITPRQMNLPINYGSVTTNAVEVEDKIHHLVSDVKNKSAVTPIKISQDANIFVGLFNAGKEASFTLDKNRMAYILMIESMSNKSTVTLTGHDSSKIEELESHAALKVHGPYQISITAPKDGHSHFLFVEMEDK